MEVVATPAVVLGLLPNQTLCEIRVLQAPAYLSDVKYFPPKKKKNSVISGVF
jgi:hypothetical protein